MGRLGLDPGTLGLKEGYEPAKPKISVGNVLNKGKTRLLMSAGRVLSASPWNEA